MLSHSQDILLFSWPTLGVVLGIIVAVITIYEKIIKPHTLKTKLMKLDGMIGEWFDEIDCNLEKGLNIASLNNKEEKISDYIRDELPRHRIKPDKLMIRQWNKMMGHKTEFQDSPELFQKYSRLPADGMYLDMYANTIFGNFYRFHNLYQTESDGCNYAEIQMPVKFLKFYVKNY